MSKNALISIENVSKSFVIYKRPLDILYDVLNKKIEADHFWALKNLSFSLQEGERLGIIGSNGAGKSTLLSIISGLLPPTSGRVHLNGKITSMLSMSSFLNEQETGIQNILFNINLLNLSQQKKTDILEEIIDFTELENFIFSPVRTYSSGMKARLAFAITTAVVPDILIIDEVLAVGDSYFVGKATQRMKNLCAKGRGLLYVSHSTGAIEMLCDKALWLDQGTMRMFGPVKEVVASYEEFNKKREDNTTRAGNIIKNIEQQQRVQHHNFDDYNYLRFRIMPQNRKKFCDLHYISHILFESENKSYEIPFETQANDMGSSEAFIDLFDSQWGQYYEKDGKSTRLLKNYNSSLLKGAHFSIRKWDSTIFNDYPFSLKINYHSEHQLEDLSIEYLDEKEAQWVPLKPTECIEDRHKLCLWKTATYEGKLNSLDKINYQKTAKKIKEIDQPKIMIKDICLTVNNIKVDSVKETQPFKIIVTAEITKEIGNYDIGLIIKKLDGTYMFWNTTGFDSKNPPTQLGLIEVEFIFEPNLFGSGDYNINVYAANGWDLEDNYPYSEIYDRKINYACLKVKREFDVLDFGLINQKIKTRIHRVDEERKKIAS
jgi:lipopolysaccharide transport system ATP-binding protein